MGFPVVFLAVTGAIALSMTFCAALEGIREFRLGFLAAGTCFGIGVVGLFFCLASGRGTGFAPDGG